MKTLDEDFPLIRKEQEQMVMNVHKKLMQARLTLQGMKLDKSGHNKFAGYKYFELGDFIPVVQKIFAEIGLCGVISYGEDEARLSITDTDEGGQIIVTSPMSTAALKGCHEVQNLGAVQTYIRRYLWVTAMEIVEHDALDSTSGKSDAKPNAIKESGKSIARAEFDGMTPEVRERLEGIARAVTEKLMVSDVPGAVEIIEHENMDADTKTAFWSLLGSPQRSAIKAYWATRKAAA